MYKDLEVMVAYTHDELLYDRHGAGVLSVHIPENIQRCCTDNIVDRSPGEMEEKEQRGRE